MAADAQPEADNADIHKTVLNLWMDCRYDFFYVFFICLLRFEKLNLVGGDNARMDTRNFNSNINFFFIRVWFVCVS